MPRPLTRAEVAALAEDLRRMLAAIEAGDLDATTAMRYRLEGHDRLRTVLRRNSSLLDSLDH